MEMPCHMEVSAGKHEILCQAQHLTSDQ